MNAEEKANELIEKYLVGAGYMTHWSAVKCAIIAVEEMICSQFCVGYYYKYWCDVKKHLNAKL